jgi:hypothetical protein
MVKSHLLSSTSGSGADLSSEASLGTSYAADQDRVVHFHFRFSSLNGAAATLTPIVRHTTSGGTMIAEYYFSAPKRNASDTVFGETIQGIVMKSGEKLEFRAVSSNASDTSVTWSRDVVNAEHVTAIQGASQQGRKTI